jgi:hypothetical protein
MHNTTIKILYLMWLLHPTFAVTSQRTVDVDASFRWCCDPRNRIEREMWLVTHLNLIRLLNAKIPDSEEWGWVCYRGPFTWRFEACSLAESCTAEWPIVRETSVTTWQSVSCCTNCSIRNEWVQQSFVRNNVSACFTKHVYHNIFRLKSKPSSGVIVYRILNANYH